MKLLKKAKLIILVLIFIAGISFLSSLKRGSVRSFSVNEFDALCISPMKGLNHDDYAEVHGYADQYVDWSFSTMPTQTINVWALEAFQYSLWTSGLPASGYLQSTSSSDSGRFNVPEGNTWYIVFWNDIIGSQYTIVTYSGSFVGDSRPPSITVYEPYGVYRAGHTIPIDWSSINAGSSVKIELFKGASLHTIIATSTSNDGYHEWTSPPDITPGTDYRIKVSSTSTAASDYSDYFEIRGPATFTISFPNSTSSISMGNYYDIKFDSSESVSEINVSLYRNDEFLYYIETERNNWGYWYEDHCPWSIPMSLTPGPNYSIYICSFTDPNTYGFSEYFEITEHRGFTFINPTRLSKILPGSEYTINWNSTGQIGNIRIELWRRYHYEDNVLISTEQILTIADNIPNTGSFIWNVPNLPTGYEYYIDLLSTTDSGCWERSEEFYIGPLPPTIPSYNLVILISFLSIISLMYLYIHIIKSEIAIKTK